MGKALKSLVPNVPYGVESAMSVADSSICPSLYLFLMYCMELKGLRSLLKPKTARGFLMYRMELKAAWLLGQAVVFAIFRS